MTRNEKKIEKLFDTFRKDSETLHVCELGSCQYATIESTYHLALGLIKIEGREAFEKRFGITYTKEQSLQEFQADLTETVRDQIKEAIERYTKENDQEYLDDALHQQAWFESRGQSITIEEYYQFTRENNWDLWSAAIVPISHFKMENGIDTPTWGPIFNIMAQSENFEFGIWLAYTTLLFGTELEAFAGFDT